MLFQWLFIQLISRDKIGVKSLRLNSDELDNNLFDKQLNDLINSKRVEGYRIFEIDETVLKSLNESEIFIIDQRSINKTYQVRFFKNKQRELAINMCNFCFRFINLWME